MPDDLSKSLQETLPSPTGISILVAARNGASNIVHPIYRSIFIGAFHWRAVYTLLREELSKGKPLDGDDCALFSFFHRRTGMPRSDFDRLRAIGAWQSFAAGDAICDTLPLSPDTP